MAVDPPKDDRSLRSRNHAGTAYTPSYSSRGKKSVGLGTNTSRTPKNPSAPVNGGSKTQRTPVKEVTVSESQSVDANVSNQRSSVPQTNGIGGTNEDDQGLNIEARTVNDLLDQSLARTSINSMEDLLGGFTNTGIPVKPAGVGRGTNPGMVALDPNPSLVAELNRCREIIKNLSLQISQTPQANPPAPPSNTAQNQNSAHSGNPRNYELRYREPVDQGLPPERPIQRNIANTSRSEPSDSEESNHADQRQPNNE